MDVGSDVRTATNWKLCCFCQQKKQEKLISPAEKDNEQSKKLYVSIEKDIKNCITNKYSPPFQLSPECLIVEGYEDISSSLCGKSAIYHKTCRDSIREKVVDAHKKSKGAANVLQVELRDITDWKLCCFCQASFMKESLVHPYLKEC